jgi:carboxymethylenebutenolidase
MGRWDQVESGGGKMDVYVAVPEGDGPHPAIILAFHRTGMDSFTTDSADRLAAAGFLTAAPNFYHRHKEMDADGAVKRRDDAEVTADLVATIAHLATLDEVASGRPVLMGHCMGGRIAMLGAVALPDAFDLCVVFYGGGVMSAWGEGPSVFDRFDRIKCPVYGFYGNEDGNPSSDDVDRFDARLSELGIEHVFHRYDGAGHAFQNPLHGKMGYRPEIAERGWKTVTGLLRDRYLA